MDAFTRIKGRYLVIIWLLPFFYMPGIEAVTNYLLQPASEWYWYDLTFYYYYHAIVAIFILVLLYYGKPNVRLMFGHFQRSEISPSLKLTAFIFIFSIAAAYILFYPLSYLIPDFVRYWFIEIPPFIYNHMGAYPIIPNLLSFISLVILAPILEEFTFRGLLLHRWKRKWGLKNAIIVSSLLFGIAHPDPIGATAFGIAMCVLYLRTQSLWIPVFCHSVYNFFVWLIEAGYQSYYGYDHSYTLQDFQDQWYFGVITILISIIWVSHYLKRPVKHRIWRLPDAETRM